MRVPSLPLWIDEFSETHSNHTGLAYHVCTHAHTDHTKGLSPSWMDGVVFCTRVTRALLISMYDLPPWRVVALTPYESYRIPIIAKRMDNKREDQKRGVFALDVLREIVSSSSSSSSCDSFSQDQFLYPHHQQNANQIQAGTFAEILNQGPPQSTRGEQKIDGAKSFSSEISALRRRQQQIQSSNLMFPASSSSSSSSFSSFTSSSSSSSFGGSFSTSNNNMNQEQQQKEEEEEDDQTYFEITLLPCAHIPGSAMVLIDYPEDSTITTTTTSNSNSTSSSTTTTTTTRPNWMKRILFTGDYRIDGVNYTNEYLSPTSSLDSIKKFLLQNTSNSASSSSSSCKPVDVLFTDTTWLHLQDYRRTQHQSLLTCRDLRSVFQKIIHHIKTRIAATASTSLLLTSTTSSSCDSQNQNQNQQQQQGKPTDCYFFFCVEKKEENNEDSASSLLENNGEEEQEQEQQQQEEAKKNKEYEILPARGIIQPFVLKVFLHNHFGKEYLLQDLARALDTTIALDRRRYETLRVVAQAQHQDEIQKRGGGFALEQKMFERAKKKEEKRRRKIHDDQNKSKEKEGEGGEEKEEEEEEEEELDEDEVFFENEDEDDQEEEQVIDPFACDGFGGGLLQTEKNKEKNKKKKKKKKRATARGMNNNKEENENEDEDENDFSDSSSAWDSRIDLSLFEPIDPDLIQPNFQGDGGGISGVIINQQRFKAQFDDRHRKFPCIEIVYKREHCNPTKLAQLEARRGGVPHFGMLLSGWNTMKKRASQFKPPSSNLSSSNNNNQQQGQQNTQSNNNNLQQGQQQKEHQQPKRSVAELMEEREELKMIQEEMKRRTHQQQQQGGGAYDGDEDEYDSSTNRNEPDLDLDQEDEDEDENDEDEKQEQKEERTNINSEEKQNFETRSNISNFTITTQDQDAANFESAAARLHHHPIHHRKDPNHQHQQQQQQQYQPQATVWAVPFSLHSSCTEIETLVDAIKPVSVYPLSGPARVLSSGGGGNSSNNNNNNRVAEAQTRTLKAMQTHLYPLLREPGVNVPIPSVNINLIRKSNKGNNENEGVNNKLTKEEARRKKIDQILEERGVFDDPVLQQVHRGYNSQNSNVMNGIARTTTSSTSSSAGVRRLRFVEEIRRERQEKRNQQNQKQQSQNENASSNNRHQQQEKQQKQQQEEKYEENILPPPPPPTTTTTVSALSTSSQNDANKEKWQQDDYDPFEFFNKF